VYIDGTNTGSTSGWLTTSDAAKVDPLAISQGTGQGLEGFETADPDNTFEGPKPPAVGQRLTIKDLKKTAGDLQAHATNVKTQSNKAMAGVQQKKYMKQYGQSAYPFLDTTKGLLKTVLQYQSPTNSKVLPVANVIDVLKNTPSTSSLIRPFIDGLIASTDTKDTDKQARINTINYLIGEINTSTSQEAMPLSSSSMTASEILVDATYNGTIPRINILNKPYVEFEINTVYPFQKNEGDESIGAFGVVPTPPQNPYPEYIANDVHAQFLADLEVFRKPLIFALLRLDYPNYVPYYQVSAPTVAPIKTPGQAKKENFTGVYPGIYHDNDATSWAETFYYGSLTLLALYMFYRLYRKHTDAFPW
jgi:hypothetical protein